MGDLALNVNNYKVLTPDGYKDFAGVSFMGDKPIMRLDFENNVWLECTFDHGIYVNLDKKIPAANLEIGDEIITSNGYAKLLKKTDLNKTVPVFDIIEVEGKHRYYANNALVSNCEFLIFEETLINSIKLSEMEGIDALEKQGQVRWFKRPTKGHTYMIGLDPAMGTGGDHAGIEVYELPDMVQVAEWQHNKTIIPQQIAVIQAIAKYLLEITESNNHIYYSVENNTLGEAALISIAEMGEENIPGIFLSEPKRKGHVRSFRKGYNTTEKSKISACAKFKSLVETNRLKVHSKNLISEMKNFVAYGSSFRAREGEHDDLVMSSLLVIRMAMTLQNYDPTLEKQLRDHLDIVHEPLPFIMVM